MRVRVINIDSVPVANALVAFTVTAGGGAVSPFIDSTDASGVAATQWTLGPALGANTVSAVVVQPDSTPNTFVIDNEVSFTITSYNALTVAGGNDQVGQILADLPQQPSVLLVDSLGNPRPGVPVQFTAFSGGRVTSSLASTNATGIATSGTWTLGDIPGDQLLEARVADARVTLRATGTGTPIHYEPASVVAGRFSTCALESDASVKCWGEVPQIGTGGANNVSTPTAVNGALVATSLDGGATHYCALTSQNEIWCWGAFALVDTSGASVNADVPTALPSDIVWKRVSAGFAHNCGIDTADATYCWGDNSAGQLGDTTNGTRFVPGLVSGGFTFTQIATGTAHTCALSSVGSAFCWGGNQSGQLGDGTSPPRTAPTAVVGNHVFQSIGSGDAFSCGLTTNGAAYCWGTLAGQTQRTPQTYPEAPSFSSMTVGDQHVCALVLDGTAYCWGINDFGRLGDSTTTARTAPTKVAGDLRFVELSAGYRHTCGRTTDGAVACWGQNRGGELGNDTSPFQLTPRYLVLGVVP